MSKELLKIKCFNAKQLEEAKKNYKNYSLTPVNKNGYKFVILECWAETDSLFSSSEAKTETTTTEELY